MARRVAVPDRVPAMGLLDRVDYGDAFTVDAAPEVLARHTPDQLTGLAMGRAPGWLRGLVVLAHRWVLGLRLVSTTPPVPVPGWQLLHIGSDEVVYGVDGGLITPRLVVRKEADHIVLVTIVRYDHPAARIVWAIVGPVHRLVARLLLDRGARLAAHDH